MKRFRKRADRAERRRSKSHGINLVSLMDIFTILVFFLLVNSADVETLSSNDSFKLPESVSETKPKETILIKVNESDIVVQGRKVAEVKAVIQSEALIIPALQKELMYHADKGKKVETEQSAFIGAITIMGDKKIPYKLLKKIMATCAESKFGNISLAVQQKAKG